MNTNKEMNRRQFLKILGTGTVASAAIMTGCSKDGGKKSTNASQNDVANGQMTYRTGKHGEKVSILGYGCMRFPTKSGTSGREDRNGELDQEQIDRLIGYAIEHGVNLFDTSPAYCRGQSEGALGKALSRFPREKFMVSTKMSNFGNWTREASIEMYHNSMRELQVDYIDFYLLHAIGGDWKGFEDRFISNGILDFLLEERAAGRIKNLGFSFHGDVKVFDRVLAMDDTCHWDFALIQHSYVDWHHAQLMNPRNVNSEYLYGELVKRDIQAFVMEPLLGGRLAKLSAHAEELLKARDPEASIASWAFRFSGSQPKILTVLSGMTYMEHLQDNVKTYSPLKPLNDSEFELLEQIADIIANFPAVPCNTCQYCMPCPYGLDIPGIFSHYNKCLNEGNVVEDLKNPEYKKARKAFLVGYDRSVPRLRQASHCIECRHCIPECPQRINIPREMRRIDNFVESLKRNGADLGRAVTMAALIKQLDSGRYSCVISNGGETRTYNQKGVQDLHDIVRDADPFAKGAQIADKVIGKGAASLIVLAGFTDVFAHTICTTGKEMLQANGIHVSFDEEVDYIINNAGTDWCPVEKLVKDCKTADECWPKIAQFVKEMRHEI